MIEDGVEAVIGGVDGLTDEWWVPVVVGVEDYSIRSARSGHRGLLGAANLPRSIDEEETGGTRRKQTEIPIIRQPDSTERNRSTGRDQERCR